jgi:hypothetical protein
MHFVHNSVVEFADELGFNPVMGMPRDVLHWILLGLFGYHIVKAKIYLMSTILLADAYFTGHGNRKALANGQTMHHDVSLTNIRLQSQRS